MNPSAAARFRSFLFTDGFTAFPPDVRSETPQFSHTSGSDTAETVPHPAPFRSGGGSFPSRCTHSHASGKRIPFHLIPQNRMKTVGHLCHRNPLIRQIHQCIKRRSLRADSESNLLVQCKCRRITEIHQHRNKDRGENVHFSTESDEVRKASSVFPLCLHRRNIAIDRRL